MKRNKNKNQKPLTLKTLAAYNQEVLFPYLEERFVSRREFNDFKNEMTDFKNESLTNQDAILKKLDILLIEKDVREYQKKKERKLWAIIIRSLKQHHILSSKELEEIARLEIF